MKTVEITNIEVEQMGELKDRFGNTTRMAGRYQIVTVEGVPGCISKTFVFPDRMSKTQILARVLAG